MASTSFSLAILIISGIFKYASTGGKPRPTKYDSSAFCLQKGG